MLASAATAHVVLENPKPFKFVVDGPTNPISTTGDDFPCKVPPGASYIIDGERTVYAVGEEQTASFKGQAVHGGGSCQFALSADAEPTKQSTWMVIHSIEGGCPARNQKGNLEGANLDKYTFSIPEGIAPGDYTFAWTWQARIGGQPEYYMNCAPITVTGAGGGGGGGGAQKKRGGGFADRRTSVAKRADFPGLFMANMGDVAGGCTTSDALSAQVPIAYPYPGASVDHPEGTSNLFKQPCDGNPRAGGGTPGGAEPPKSGGGSGTASSAPGGEPGARPVSTRRAGASSAAEEVLPVTPPATATGAARSRHTSALAPSRPPAECPVKTVVVTVTVTVAAGGPAASGAPGTPGGAAPGGCTEGKLTCLPDETHFATCTGGKLTRPQPIAPGFKCRAGESDGLDISPL
ncbi:hypothetical protein C8034_v007707 [Colletotrichum sidae]|uniref:Endo-beta-1,4-glucanase D n=1 Tax=Colletotrichum sidae TaxID=1347389 RepID=A0A4R8T337_9PEZI|nr:hypothetical protein C8034_v007707 [Colletotrichum sidae]